MLSTMCNQNYKRLAEVNHFFTNHSSYFFAQESNKINLTLLNSATLKIEAKARSSRNIISNNNEIKELYQLTINNKKKAKI